MNKRLCINVQHLRNSIGFVSNETKHEPKKKQIHKESKNQTVLRPDTSKGTIVKDVTCKDCKSSFSLHLNINESSL